MASMPRRADPAAAMQARLSAPLLPVSTDAPAAHRAVAAAAASEFDFSEDFDHVFPVERLNGLVDGLLPVVATLLLTKCAGEVDEEAARAIKIVCEDQYAGGHHPTSDPTDGDGDRDDNEQCTWTVVAGVMWYRPHYRFLMSTLVFFTIYFAWFGNASSYFQVERASKACILAQLSWCVVISAMPLTLQPILSHHSDGGNPRYAVILGATQMVAFTMMGAIVAKLAPCGETIAVDGAKHATFRIVAIQSNVLLGLGFLLIALVLGFDDSLHFDLWMWFLLAMPTIVWFAYHYVAPWMLSVVCLGRCWTTRLIISAGGIQTESRLQTVVSAITEINPTDRVVEFGRLELFSDGVFIITIMLELVELVPMASVQLDSTAHAKALQSVNEFCENQPLMFEPEPAEDVTTTTSGDACRRTFHCGNPPIPWCEVNCSALMNAGQHSDVTAPCISSGLNASALVNAEFEYCKFWYSLSLVMWYAASETKRSTRIAIDWNVNHEKFETHLASAILLGTMWYYHYVVLHAGQDGNEDEHTPVVVDATQRQQQETATQAVPTAHRHELSPQSEPSAADHTGNATNLCVRWVRSWCYAMAGLHIDGEVLALKDGWDVHASIWNGICLFLVGLVPYCVRASVFWKGIRKASTLPLFCLGFITLLFVGCCLVILQRAPRSSSTARQGIINQLRMGVFSSVLMMITATVSFGHVSIATMTVAPIPVLLYTPITSAWRATRARILR